MPRGRGLLVYNPRSGNRDRREEIRGVVERSRARGLTLLERPTERAGHATELVRDGLAERPDVVVVMGGDGTIAEAAAALVGTGVPLGLLPVGTTNVVAREYGVRGPLEETEKHLVSDRVRPLTAFPVSVSAWRDVPASVRTSLIGTGVGFDARVMGNTVPILKRLFGRTGIGYTATLEWLKYEFPPIEVEGIDADGKPFRAEATFVLSANTTRYGGDPVLSPFADPEDDLLDLVLFTGKGRGTLIRFYHLLSQGKAGHLGVDGVSRRPVRSFTARSKAGYELEVQVDGDLAGATPVSVGPAAGPVHVVVPA